MYHKIQQETEGHANNITGNEVSSLSQQTISHGITIHRKTIKTFNIMEAVELYFTAKPKGDCL